MRPVVEVGVVAMIILVVRIGRGIATASELLFLV